MQATVPVMAPAPGEHLRRFVGDHIRFALKAGERPISGWRAMLRTNLGRANHLREEILRAHAQGLSLAGASWRDIPMAEDTRGWFLDMPLVEVGHFKAKAYLLDPRGWQHWPEGSDVGISVHPDRYRTGNTIYCAFTRMFGATRTRATTNDAQVEATLAALDETGYAVIPPSGKLRDLTRELPHITSRLGCKILHLLPVHPTPTTYARFGRFGSPYAALDLGAIDPALVEFDKRTTGVDQFRELTYGAHLRGARVFLDIVINHTGWGSVLQENHPEWFLRDQDRFVSPGAWGVTWEDLVELKHDNVELWDALSDVFLIWCRRGVDGFRCDAGYKVPVPAWQYVIARVQQEYPETVFLLEGLGGAWSTSEDLLTEGGMQWAYSELFQNYSGHQVSSYLDHSLKQSSRVGLLVHYAETHDNERLAARGRAWSLLRNQLSALASVNGGFGFTCGVEWLAAEKIRVHGSSGMSWGAQENLLPELSSLNRLLAEHPCFFDGARLTRLSPADSDIYALSRRSAEGLDHVVVMVNTHVKNQQTLTFELKSEEAGLPDGAGRDLRKWVDLLGQKPPELAQGADGRWTVKLEPGAACCLAPAAKPHGLPGEEYRRSRARAAWALWALSQVVPVEGLGAFDWQRLAEAVERSPSAFLARISHLEGKADLATLIEELQGQPSPAFRPVVLWTLSDRRRVTMVPPGHWLLVEDEVAFRARLTQDSALATNVESVSAAGKQFACFAPRERAGDAKLSVERYAPDDPCAEGVIRFLPQQPKVQANSTPIARDSLRPTDLVLLTNGRGAMARLALDLGRVQSKYDCVLGANLHPALPVDRHIFAKRIRVWVNAHGFISPLDFRNLAAFTAGPPATWTFVANAGDARTVEIQVRAQMLHGQNSTLFDFSRPTAEQASGKQLPPEADVRLTVRLDIEDRNFHWETRRNGGAEHHFSTHTRPLAASPRAGERGADATPAWAGFVFAPAADRQLRVVADTGRYHPQPEWSDNIAHPIEQSRGQVGSGDACSPGWFEIPLPKGGEATLLVTAEAAEPEPAQIEMLRDGFHPAPAGAEANDFFEQNLRAALRAFVVRRGAGQTVIAGYPWFLDWGRDTFICARGLLAAGLLNEVRELVLTFARFEKDGTLPNTIFGEDASNRDTTDAPLWFALVCEELSAIAGPIEGLPVDSHRTVGEVLLSIARNYVKGTPNGIRLDPGSGLIWSPSHFTWMDTNYPACTPREGYPVEIQALWIRLLRQLAARAEGSERAQWQELTLRAEESLARLFWQDRGGYFADVLLAGPGTPAARATADDALRSNCLFVVSLGLAEAPKARRCVEAARRHLVVPGALRSLAPLPVSVPLPNRGANGQPLNDPLAPYWGHYEGDEDTRRKPAYHNGTAWTWTFPVFCEALAMAWDFAPSAVAAAKAYLGSMSALMAEGCLGQLPEVVDGDFPHTQRGCDAQAWSATEALRVWRRLREADRGA